MQSDQAPEADYRVITRPRPSAAISEVEIYPFPTAAIQREADVHQP